MNSTAEMKSAITKHSLVIKGHKTSISLEPVFWEALRKTATNAGKTLAKLVEEIDGERDNGNLSSAIRCYLFRRYAVWPQP